MTLVLAFTLALASLPIAPAIVSATPSTTLVISQFQTKGSTTADEFVELHNVGPNPVDLNGYRLVWRAGTDTADTTLVAWTASAIVQPGQYYLVGAGPGYNDPITADVTYTDNGTGIITEIGGLALRNGAADTGAIIDSVAYGSVPSDFLFIEGTKTAVPVQNGSRARYASAATGGGCQDSDNNNSDFISLATSRPRNSSSAPLYCVPSNPQGVGTATPDPASAGSAVLLTVAVTPGKGPDSTGLAVTADLTTLGGSATQAFYDDGTHGDATANDNTFSFLAAIPPAAAGGALSIPAAISDAQSRSVTVTITVNVTARTFIYQLQGAAQVSPRYHQSVNNVQGVVTALRSNGFYLEGSDDPTYGDRDSDPATSEGIFVFTSSAPTVAVGNRVSVGGTVEEYHGSGSAAATNLPVTELTAPTIAVLATGVALPAPVVVGAGGRVPPTSVIEDDVTGGNAETGDIFDPSSDGLDYWESLEGMLVQVNNPLAVGPTKSFGSNRELPIVGDNGANASTLTPRGGIIVQASDFNPERIILNDLIAGGPTLPQVNTGAALPGPIVGVIDYSFGNFKLQITAPSPFGVPTGGATRATTSVTAGANQLTVATFNVQNLSPLDPQTKFDTLAGYITTNLGAPDILAIEEVQDNSGSGNDGAVDATTTVNLLLAAITRSGGPAYQAAWINPQNNHDGGQPGGNIRVVFLYRTDRGVAFVNQPYNGTTCPTNDPATCPVGVTGTGSATHLTFNPGRVDPQNAAFTDSRKPLAGEFTFNGHTIFVIGNHFNSKSGDQPLYGASQPPARPSEAQRQEQAQVVHDFAQQLLAADPQANIVVLGDLNDFQFSTTLATLTGSPALLHPLVSTLPANEQYTYVYDGNSEALDHILLSDNLFANAQYAYDIVHLNAEFADQISDHDPQVVRLTLLAPPTAAPVTVTTDQDTSTPITLAGTASNGGPLTYTVVSGPSHGTLGTLNGATLTYQPATGYSGPDSFMYKVTENGLDSNVATVSITVAHVNHPPVASDGTAATLQETPVTITLAASDPDSDPLTYSIISGPAHGQLSMVTGNQVTYTPNAGYFGPDSFTFAASDGAASSNTATVTLAVNGRPIATAGAITTAADTPATITLTGSDPEGGTLTYSVVTGPAHGVLGVIDGNHRVVYTPASGYSGPDSFTFKVNDGAQDSTAATISITIAAPPIAND
ncbi:MAG TPA: Ig-like domain-containing protein, partial [Thermomicrobiales bacterium]|nr:Ig-like domain-containing protein [Thermomicrobiales bacterium]